MSNTPVILLALACIAVIAIIRAARGAGSTTIYNPRLALLNYAGTIAEPLMAEDERASRPLFASVVRSAAAVPQCDVLLIYATLASDGSLNAFGRKLRDIISSSGASIAVVALPNSVETCQRAVRKDASFPRAVANIVMTLDRNGECFSPFFAGIFRRMHQGSSMLSAWAQLAPQHEGAVQHRRLPSTFLLCERGNVRFVRR